MHQLQILKTKKTKETSTSRFGSVRLYDLSSVPALLLGHHCLRTCTIGSHIWNWAAVGPDLSFSESPGVLGQRLPNSLSMFQMPAQSTMLLGRKKESLH
jgi:hypothetical protein